MGRMNWLSEILLVTIWSGILLCILIQFGGDQKQQSTIKHQEIVIKNAQEVTQIFLNSSSKVYGPQKKKEIPNPISLHEKYSDIRKKDHDDWITGGGVGVQPPLTDKFPCGAFVSHKYRFIFIKQQMAYSDEFFSDFLGGECKGDDYNSNNFNAHRRHLNGVNLNSNSNFEFDDFENNNILQFEGDINYQRRLKQFKNNIDYDKFELNKHQRHINQQSFNIQKYEKQGNPNCMVRLVNMKEEEAKKSWKEYFVFTVVRNPWIRALQTYQMLQRSGFLNVSDAACFTPRENFCQHPHLLAQKCMDKPYCCEQHADNVVISLHRQSNCLRHSNGQITVDFVARAENLEEDLNQAIDIINKDYRDSSVPQLPKLRPGEYSSKIEEEDNQKLGLHKQDKCISDIAWHYQDDIDFLGLNDVLKYKQSWELPPKQDEIIQWISQF